MKKFNFLQEYDWKVTNNEHSLFFVVVVLQAVI